MKRILKTFAVLPLFWCTVVTAQQKIYSVANAHSHNDYLNLTPFRLAFLSGFGSIEADVFPVEGKLCVAHKKEEIQTRLTLKDLYIDPLVKEFTSSGPRKLSLLIDIKKNYFLSLSILMNELAPLRPYLTTPGVANYITVIISGERPVPADYKNYPDYIFFDADLKFAHTENEWERVALVSLPFNKISAWKGEGRLARKDKKKLRHIIDSIHTAGKPIRFWAAPDTKTSWKWQIKLHADLIGTDKINELREYLRKKSGS